MASTSTLLLIAILGIGLCVIAPRTYAQTRDNRQAVSADIYFKAYMGIHYLVDQSIELVMRSYPQRTRLVTLTDPLLLRQITALVDGIEQRSLNWYQGIDTRIVCILRFADQSVDTVAFGNSSMQYHGKYLEYDRKLLLLLAEQLPLYDRSLIENFVAYELQRESILNAWAADSTCRCTGARTRERLEQLFELVNFENGSRAKIVRYLGEPDFERSEAAINASVDEPGEVLGYYLQLYHYRANRDGEECFVTFTVWPKKDSIATTFVCADK